MTEVLTQDSKPSFGITFRKAVSDGNYGTDEVSAWVSADVPLGASTDIIEEALRDAAFLAKVTVYDQLGLSYTNDAGVLRPETAVQKVERAFGGKATIEPADDLHTPQKNPQQSGTNVIVKVWNDTTKRYDIVSPQPELPSWFVDAAAEAGVKEVVDQRDKVATSATNIPWFKEIGKGKNGRAFWPPKGPR
jgi:hypothetical protein